MKTRLPKALRQALAAKAEETREQTIRIGKRVRELRGQVTQGALAKRAGVSRLTVHYLETGQLSSVKATTLFGLARALGVSAEDLLGDSND